MPFLKKYIILGLSLNSKVYLWVTNFHGGHRYKVVKSVYHKSFNEIQLVKVELESLQQEVTNFQSLHQITIWNPILSHTKHIMQNCM